MKNINVAMGNMNVELNVNTKEDKTMDKAQYAAAVAQAVNGVVKQVNKPNGIVLTGVVVGEGDIRPTIYVEDMYEKGVSVDDAAKQVMEMAEKAMVSAPGCDMNAIMVYDTIKDKLRLRLYNEKTECEVFTSAKKYGFDDLILIPYVDLGSTSDGILSTKVTEALLKTWGVTKTKVISDAMKATKANVSYKVKSMRDTMIEMMGEGAEMFFPEEPGVPQMLTVMSEDKAFGAIGAIVCKSELKKRFPNGYYIIPSSIHEVLAVPSDQDQDALDNMIDEVNRTQVLPEEVLGWKAYKFEGVA